MKTIHFLSDIQLKELTPERLLKVLRSARAVESNIIHHHGNHCCEIIAGNLDEDVVKYSEPFTQYISKIKKILSNKRHVIRRKKKGKTK